MRKISEPIVEELGVYDLFSGPRLLESSDYQIILPKVSVENSTDWLEEIGESIPKHDPEYMELYYDTIIDAVTPCTNLFYPVCLPIEVGAEVYAHRTLDYRQFVVSTRTDATLVVHEDGYGPVKYFLGLTNFQKDTHWQIARAYMLLGSLPPISVALSLESVLPSSLLRSAWRRSVMAASARSLRKSPGLVVMAADNLEREIGHGD
jgi:hypothetical protein